MASYIKNNNSWGGTC